MKWGAVREMHQPSAAGTAIECRVEDDGRNALRRAYRRFGGGQEGAGERLQGVLHRWQSDQSRRAEQVDYQGITLVEISL